MAATLSRGRALLRTGVVMALAVALLGITPLAHADDLNNKKNATQTQIDNNKKQTSQDQTALSKAAAALKTAQANLVDAQADLAAKQQAMQDAQDEYTKQANLAAQAEKDLAARQAELATAQQAVVDGQAQIDAKRDTIAVVAQTTAQQNTSLLSLAMVFSNLSSAQMNDRFQWASLVFDTNQDAMNQLVQAQQVLQQAQATAQQAEQKATAAQAAAQQAQQSAATQLTAAQNAAASSKQAQQSVTAKVAATQKAQADAQAAINADKAKSSQLQQQLAQIEAQIKAAAAAVTHVNQPPASSSSGKGVSPSTAQSIAKGLLPKYGFSSGQFSCLVNLWNYESGWRWNATNRSSGAYGIPQALPASKMASVGSDWRTNAKTQIKWGLNYIKGRYGSPCGAWSHFKSYNWY